MRQFGLTSELLLLKGQDSWWVNCLQIPSKTIHRILTLSGARFYNLRQPSHAWWSPLFKGMWLGFPNGIGQNPHLCSFMGNSRSRGSPSLLLLWDTAACLLVSSELDARPLECACSPLGRKPLGSRAVTFSLDHFLHIIQIRAASQKRKACSGLSICALWHMTPPKWLPQWVETEPW